MADQKDNNQENSSGAVSDGTTKEQIKQETKDLLKDFGSAGVDDINKNLGSFANTVNSQEQLNQVRLDVNAQVVEQASKEKVDFERFSKTRKDWDKSKTKFGEKVGLLLRNKKGLTITWILEIVFMFIIIAASAVVIGKFSKYIGWTLEGPMCFPAFQRCLKAGIVFHWISLFPCFIPLIYLLTTWFIGINQVYSSKMFHYFFWISAAFSLLCFIIGIVVMIYPISEWMQWGGDKLLVLTSFLK